MVVFNTSANLAKTCAWTGWRPFSMFVIEVLDIFTARANASCV
jgi:hypothetical protein